MKRLPLLFSLLALILLSASAAFWGMQLFKPVQRPLASSAPAALPDPSPDAAATLFGGQAVAVVATSYQLTGVVFAGNESVAILQAEGQPPKALPVGKEIAPGVVIKEVHPRYVMLSEGGILKRIDLATDSKGAANVDMLPPGGAQMRAPEAPPGAGQAPGGNEMTGGGPPPAGPVEPPPPPPQQMPQPPRTMSQQQPTE